MPATMTRAAGGQPCGPIALDGPAVVPAAGMDTPIRVLIADGKSLVRAAYRALLERDERIEVVCEAAGCEQALALARDAAPDVALLDLALPGLDEVGTIAAFAPVAVIVIAPCESDELVFSALGAGAVSVLAEDSEPAELIRAVHLLAGGQALLPAHVVRRLLEGNPPPCDLRGPPPEGLNELTDREREVLALVGRGLSNGDIAARLVISPATAKTHVSRAMFKLKAHDRAQLAVLAFESGLVLPDGDAFAA
jgi:DNA-binding NarL/FixJ family response regulator